MQYTDLNYENMDNTGVSKKSYFQNRVIPAFEISNSDENKITDCLYPVCNNTRPSNCEFCQELLMTGNSRFRLLYGSEISTRILLKNNHFLAVPTLGQLIKGSILILPIKHYETLSDIPRQQFNSLLSILKSVENKISTLGNPIIFEHGARCNSKHGCGIYHAHLHVIPVHRDIFFTDIFPEKNVYNANNLIDALELLHETKSYLLFRDTKSRFVYIDASNAPPHMLKSQWFRRTLVQYFKLNSDWNWRNFNYIEPWLLETIHLFSRINNK